MEDAPQCNFYVLRKKRLCRMTVKPGRQHCGEHEPLPRIGDGQIDNRIPCPLDPKHTCFASKLEKHLSICNARQGEIPSYIEHNINAPPHPAECPRRPLSEISKKEIALIIDKVNYLYEKYIKDKIHDVAEQPIHPAVLEEFSEPDRAESSLRHLRQVSSLLHIMENEGLVKENTCYVELGAGKGQLSYYMGVSWCANTSCVALVERAALRHKRDNRLPRGERGEGATRLRVDLAHLRLELVPCVADCATVVGIAKHLCGVATDLALRCITAEGVLSKTQGAAVATCCHHRCERAAYVATQQLQNLGINAEEFNIILGIVSWATCGDGRSRERRKQAHNNEENYFKNHLEDSNSHSTEQHNHNNPSNTMSKENKFDDNHAQPEKELPTNLNALPNTNESKTQTKLSNIENQMSALLTLDERKTLYNIEEITLTSNIKEAIPNMDKENVITEPGNTKSELKENVFNREYREQVGRRAKALLDWGRVLYLREKGFDARLCHYVPATVSLENVCIVAKKMERDIK